MNNSKKTDNTFEKWCLENKPELLDEWHPTKNDYVKPSDVRPKSNKKVWWLGKCGHEWEISPNHRLSGNGCPICAGKKILIGFNDLPTTNPELATEWHPTKNGDLKPTDVFKGTHKIVWWKGKCGHEWQAAVYSRASGKGCPVCYGRKVLIGFNDLQTVNPNLAAEWHPTKNGDLKPTDVVGASNKKVWWLCKEGHEWQASINSRKRGNGCKICAGQTAIAGVNDIKSQRPDLISDWDYEKNDIHPDEIAIQSNVPVWWKCKDCGHSWKAAPYSRIRSSCPKCMNDMHSSFGEKAIVYYLSKVVPVTERYRDKFLGKMELDVYLPTLKVALEYDGCFYHNDIERDLKKDTICKQNGIDLIRFREIGCPIISTHSFIIDPLDRNSLTSSVQNLFRYLKERYDIEGDLDVDVERDSLEINELKYSSRKINSLSIQYPEIAKQFHPTKNGVLKPDIIPSHSNEKIWWVCDKGHEWKAIVSSRVRGNGCPYCAGRKVMPGFNDLQTVSPKLAAEWHPILNGDLKPTDVTRGSHKKVWWSCPKGHEWQTRVYNRARGSGCPYCLRILKKNHNNDSG